jgi:hypothetical protein
VEEGLFVPAYKLRDDPALSETEREQLSDTLDWFETNLKTPARFNRTRSKGYYRRNTRGIAWFRDTANECISRMHVVKRLIESHGYAVAVIDETHVGYIVSEGEARSLRSHSPTLERDSRQAEALEAHDCTTLDLAPIPSCYSCPPDLLPPVRRRSVNTKPSRSTTSPISTSTFSLNIGPAVTQVWNSPRSPHGSTPSGNSSSSS